ncbi:MAG: ABC transporter permease subunit [Rickettsiales bacterium]
MRFNFCNFTTILGFLFLYLPIIILIVFSFNSSSLISVWQGFSLTWYEKLWQDEEIISAFFTSFKIASFSATGAVIIGTLAGLSLQRISFFRGKSIFSILLPIPLVVPEVVAGFAISLVFLTLNKLIGVPHQFGFETVVIAHMVIGVTYVALMVQAKLAELDPSFEEAALDLGATPFKVFILITMPLIAPALISGWLLCFTISLDDLIIASFTSGSGITTLPMLIYSRIRFGISPVINALATIIIVIVLLLTILALSINLAKKQSSLKDR